jgi:hypothetical protein
MPAAALDNRQVGGIAGSLVKKQDLICIQRTDGRTCTKSAAAPDCGSTAASSPLRSLASANFTCARRDGARQDLHVCLHLDTITHFSTYQQALPDVCP